MLSGVIYFLIAIAATTAGAMTGMGGGVIIKPVLDVLGDFDVATIGVLSSITVFAMAIVSVGKQVQQKATIRYRIAIPLAIGSVAGGIVGQQLLTIVLKTVDSNQLVKAIQNIALAILIVVVFVYMLYKSKIRTLGVKGIFPSLLVGVFLGIVSSFLGIGGGPINVALLIFVFSFDTKTAAVCSIITILFAQISKLSSVALGVGFAAYDLSLLLPMVIGAVMGGFIGSWLNKKLTEKMVEICFNGVQVLVFALCIYNVVVNLP